MLKLGPVPIVDEVALIIDYFVNKRWKNKLRTDFFGLLMFWLLLISLAGFFYGSINALRFIVLSILLLFFPKNDALSGCVNFKSIICASWSVILLYFFILAFSEFQGYKIAWWQDYLFTGTAYAALPVYVAAVFLMIYYSNNVLANYIILLIVLSAAVFADSRFGLMTVSYLFFVYVFVKREKLTLSGVVSKYVFLAFPLILTFLFTDVGGLVFLKVKSVYLTIVDMFPAGAGERDFDRKRHLSVIVDLVGNDFFHFLFGKGMFTHQYDLLEYLPSGSDGKVRPTGLPAIIFDGGFIMLLLVLFNSMITAFFLLFQYVKKRLPFYDFSLLLSFPFWAIISVPITNGMDMVLWWLMISPGGLTVMLIKCRGEFFFMKRMS